MKEVWIDVIDYEGLYEVSNHGRVRRHVNSLAGTGAIPGRILKPAISRGYKHVTLSKNSYKRNHRVHVLVMTSFCGLRPFEGAQVCHNDGDTLNCNLTNLRWDSAYGNQFDVERHGNRMKGSSVFGAKLDDETVKHIRKRISEGALGVELASELDVSPSTISLIKLNKIWRHLNV